MAIIKGVRYSRGNRKVGVDTIIINITSAHKCKSLAQNWKAADGSFLPDAPAWARRGEDLCQVPHGTCYAWKSENLYRDHKSKTGKLVTGCMHNRDEQTVVWDALGANPAEFAESIKAIIAKENRSRAKTVLINGQSVPIQYVRFQESGDFRNQADVDLMSKIASLLPVKSYTYTARKDLDFSRVNSNLQINGSGFRAPGVTASFKVVDKSGYAACPRGNSATFDCNLCDKPCNSPRCRGIKRGGCMGCSLCKVGGNKIIRELLQSATKKDMETLRKKGNVSGGEHGGVPGEDKGPTEILELDEINKINPNLVEPVTKKAKISKLTKKSIDKPIGLGGIQR